MPVKKIIPASKDYLWGGRKLITDYGKAPQSDIMAESWELSCHPDGPSVVEGDRITLTEYLDKGGKEVLGTNCARFSYRLPILIKLIDAAAPLSVQVHPSDGWARANEGDNGKTEVWHILDCGSDAFIYYGVKEKVSATQLAEAIQNNTVTELLRKQPVKPGDTYFIEAGTIHAIGADIIIAEIQQNSNVTYRLYDYDRRDAAGNPRELHVDKGVAVSRLIPNPEHYNFDGHLALCDYFCVDTLELSDNIELVVGADSFVSLLVTGGSGKAECGGVATEFKKGDSLFIPANSGTVRLTGSASLLKTIVPPAAYRIGIDLGGTNIKIGIVDSGNGIVAKKSIKTLVERPWQEVVRDMGNGVLDLLAENGITTGEVVSMGIGSPGIVDAATGEVVYSNNFFWEHIPLVRELKKYVDLPVSITNDANCAALGEVVAGAAAGCSNAVLITLGTGVGGGVVIDGRVFEGGFAGGAELGHTSLVVGGEPCTCGRRGCFESYASATALIREARRAAERCPESLLCTLCGGDLNKLDGKMPFDAAQSGDPAARRVVDDYIMYLGEGIANLINIFRPEKVILSGGVCAQGENLTRPLEEFARKSCFGADKAFVAPVVIATLGNDAGIIGAANL